MAYTGAGLIFLSAVFKLPLPSHPGNELIFTDGGCNFLYEFLCEFRRQITAYVVFGQNYLNFPYIKAESSASNHLNSDMKDGITSMVKKFAPSIIDQYGATTWLL